MYKNSLITLLLLLLSQTTTARTMIAPENLSELSYKVTQLGYTEKPFANAYWDNHQEGIYVDMISGIPLFSSRDKYDSSTGWPTFSRPINRFVLRYITDNSLSTETRTEVRSRKSDAHLGHLFLDGPEEYNKKRYCINSAALRFIPKEKMKAEGYNSYLRFLY